MKDMSEVKKTIEELKGVVLAIHRNAGHLDSLIQGLEKYYDGNLDNVDDVNYLNIQLKCAYACREAYNTNLHIRKIDQRESELWNKLIKFTNEEGESQ